VSSTPNDPGRIRPTVNTAGVVRADEVDETAVDSMLSPHGWAYASSPPVEAGDPGRYHALFGRDSLIFALQVLPIRPAVARATLRALAAGQGRIEDPEIEEEIGRIGHEFRPDAPSWLVDLGWPVRNGAIRYYGTSDATSWFLVLLAATRDEVLADELAECRGVAAAWLERSLDAGGGFIRCGPRMYSGGLAQQGWRDVLDPVTDPHGGGIVRSDGSMPSPPLADADSQAAAFAALRALQYLDPARTLHWASLAEDLRTRIEDAFLPNVMALEGTGDGRVSVPGAGSQLGWLLWSGALTGTAADAAAARLIEPDVLTLFGVRTLASSHPAFLADGYHRGAIWPFDNWIAWGGLRAANCPQAAEQIKQGVRSALRVVGRYPELYAVEGDRLASIPISNRVQAWTVGAMAAFALDWDGRR
jgi:glycogen debranching enzyme